MFSPKTPRNPNRKMTESSHTHRSSSKKIEINVNQSSGIKIILQDLIINQNSEQIREALGKYLRYEESYSKLRPVDIQIMNEYAFTQVAFVKEFSSKRELIVNILLHMFFYRNTKYIKTTYAEKNPIDDQREFHRLLIAHKHDLNSLEVRTLLKWFDDYLNHCQLFYFKADTDDGLDIEYKVMIDVPTFVPPLHMSNFIPQNKNKQVEADSEEEEKYAYRSHLQQQKDETMDLGNQSQLQLQEEVKEVPKGSEFDEYIEQQVFGTSRQIFKQIDDQDKQILDTVEQQQKKKK